MKRIIVTLSKVGRIPYEVVRPRIEQVEPEEPMALSRDAYHDGIPYGAMPKVGEFEHVYDVTMFLKERHKYCHELKLENNLEYTFDGDVMDFSVKKIIVQILEGKYGARIKRIAFDV